MLLNRLYLFGLVFSTAILPAHKLKAQFSKPNIIFILGDDIGYNAITANGGRSFSTPNLDSIAANGIRFTQCHSSPLCSPSRSMLLTGKYNFRNYTQWGVLDQSQKTFGNLLKNAGYATACFGKWQMGGGGESIRGFGFDNYSVTYPFTPDVFKTRIYKSPVIYANGRVVPASLTTNQYSEDIFTDSVEHFIERNKDVPFFIYYPMILGHSPFEPTPDDAAFSTWQPGMEDTAFYPSMVKYMDKKIGQIVAKVKSLDLEKNTIILYAGDNGTPTQVHDLSDTNLVVGEKGRPTEAGTRVPLLAYCPGIIAPGMVSNELIDFTDFLPTLAKISNISIPKDYGVIDGVDFSGQLTGRTSPTRSWIFDHYDSRLGNNTLKRWAQTRTYKLLEAAGKLSFYNLVADRNEKKPIPDAKLSPDQIQVKEQLQQVLNNYAAQSAPILFSSSVYGITDSSAVFSATIADPVLSPVLERGTIYNSSSLDTFSTSHPSIEGGVAVSEFVQRRKGLLPQQNYFFSGYAINSNDTGFSPVKSFYTLSKSPFSASAKFEAIPAPNSIEVNWSPAIFPQSGAKKAGYLFVFSNGTPALVADANGKPPKDAVSNGTLVPLPSRAIPVPLDTFAIVTGLKERTQYNFLLIPYTWDGVNTATYNYMTNGAKTTHAIPGAIVAEVFPNPSVAGFTLQIGSNSNEPVTIRITGSNGNTIYENRGKSNDLYKFGSNWVAGMYVITIYQGENRQTVKIIKGTR